MRAVMATAIALVFASNAEAQEHTAAIPTWEISLPSTSADIPAAARVAPDSIRVHAGYQLWRGTGLGAAIGGAVGALGGAIAGTITECYDCARQPSAGEGALIGGVFGAGVGSVLGFLAGLSSPKYVWVPAPEIPDGR